jgi:single-stranded-DNA-specific exonuclease
MRWIEKYEPTAESHAAILKLAGEMQLRTATAQTLWGRNIRDPETCARFLSPQLSHLPDPFGLKGIEAAVSRMVHALEQREAVCIYGDYDVDGVTSTALLVSTLRKFAACAPVQEGKPGVAKIEFYVPQRLIEGYGLNLAALEKLSARGIRLLVSADCGVTAVAEIDGAAKLGLDVVVIDHHTASQSAEDLPRAVAILNPHQPGCTFPGRELAAVGVAFNLLLALRKRLREKGWFARAPEPNLREALDLVALGTVADVVPLTGSNRVLVHHGLRELSRGARPGILALKEIAQLKSEVTAGDVGFKLGPRINAAGRLDDASVGVRLLLSEDLTEARALAAQLDKANAERQELQARIAVEALKRAEEIARGGERRSIVVCATDWHVGVVGIVAARLVERFHRPALVLAETGGVAKGSGRSIEGFHLYDALARCQGHLQKFGGHKHAAGMTLDARELPAFAEAFEREAASQLTADQLTPRVRIDAKLEPRELEMGLADELQKLAPFGAGNPEPVFASHGLHVSEQRVLPDKRGTGPGHLKLRVGASGGADSESIGCIGFGLGDRKLEAGSPVDAAFQLSVDTWNGNDRLQLKLKDVRSAP